MAKKKEITLEDKILAFQTVRSIVEADKTLAVITSRAPDAKKLKDMLSYIDIKIKVFVDESLPF